MRRNMKLTLTVGALVTVAASSAAAQRTIPIRSLTPTLAASRDTFGIILNARQLSGGRVLINDAKRHRLVVLDSALRIVRVVFDSTVGSADSYGSMPEPVLPYPGDSSLFVDAPSQSLVLIGPDGTVGRTLSAPADAGIWTVISSSAGVDSRGRLIYRGLEMRHERKPGAGGGLSVNLPGFGRAPISNADSLPLIRGDLATRSVDTIAALKNLSASRMAISTAPNGDAVFTTYVNPLLSGDEWTLLSDGTIAIVRGQDYRVDWIDADGKVTSTPKLPFDWRRVTDDDKQRIRDSAAIAVAQADSEVSARIRAATGGATGGAAAAVVGRGGAGGASGGGGAPRGMHRVTTIAPISEMPDYVPSIRAGAVLGDRDGNLWILPTTSAQSKAGELVYDVVNRQGELFERVRLPLGRSIIGFGPGGVVYLVHGDLTNGFVLERTRIVQ